MELKAIIGKTTGKIEESDATSIESHLRKIGTLPNNGCYTNATRVEDFSIVGEKGKNLYIHALNLRNLQSFHHYLSQEGFVLRDSKIIYKKC